VSRSFVSQSPHYRAFFAHCGRESPPPFLRTAREHYRPYGSASPGALPALRDPQGDPPVLDPRRSHGSLLSRSRAIPWCDSLPPSFFPAAPFPALPATPIHSQSAGTFPRSASLISSLPVPERPCPLSAGLTSARFLATRAAARQPCCDRPCTHVPPADSPGHSLSVTSTKTD
jgi:hypothetical protein